MSEKLLTICPLGWLMIQPVQLKAEGGSVRSLGWLEGRRERLLSGTK